MATSAENDTSLQTKKGKKHKNVILIGIGITAISIALIVGIILGVSFKKVEKDPDSKNVREDHRSTRSSGNTGGFDANLNF